MENSITIKMKTLSNLFIGGAPVPFKIGGIDQQTATDQEGFPCIPASSLKGALRAVIREDDSAMADEINRLFTKYLINEKEKNWPEIQTIIDDKEALKRIEERYLEAANEVSPEYLFGIKGFNLSLIHI